MTATGRAGIVDEGNWTKTLERIAELEAALRDINSIAAMAMAELGDGVDISGRLAEIVNASAKAHR